MTTRKSRRLRRQRARASRIEQRLYDRAERITKRAAVWLRKWRHANDALQAEEARSEQ